MIELISLSENWFIWTAIKFDLLKAVLTHHSFMDGKTLVVKILKKSGSQSFTIPTADRKRGSFVDNNQYSRTFDWYRWILLGNVIGRRPLRVSHARSCGDCFAGTFELSSSVTRKMILNKVGACWNPPFVPMMKVWWKIIESNCRLGTYFQEKNLSLPEPKVASISDEFHTRCFAHSLWMGLDPHNPRYFWSSYRGRRRQKLFQGAKYGQMLAVMLPPSGLEPSKGFDSRDGKFVGYQQARIWYCNGLVATILSGGQWIWFSSWVMSVKKKPCCEFTWKMILDGCPVHLGRIKSCDHWK